MKVFLVGDVPAEFSERLKRLGFELSRELPQERDVFVLFFENCEEARRLGFGCFTREDLEGFLQFVGLSSRE